jgi:hypothetical protein
MSEPEQENPEKEAADAERGEQQEPKQAQEESSTFWDTDQHSDAPGPFGTGEDTERSAAAGNEPGEDEGDEAA